MMSTKRKGCIKKAMIAVFSLALLTVVGLLLGARMLSEPLPQGTRGAQADALAHRMMAAINHEAWNNTGAVAWNFDNRQHHLWDRHRHLARVSWDDFEVLVDLTKKTGVVLASGKQVHGEQARELVAQAWAHWANDSFWLNPISKLFDEGVIRTLVPLENGAEGLLITYASGGVTPGDSYLWHVDESGLPTAWQMWVSIIPLGGLKATWEGWSPLDTGVKVATNHKIAFLNLEMLNIKATSTLAELIPGVDPFAPLLNQ